MKVSCNYFYTHTTYLEKETVIYNIWNKAHYILTTAPGVEDLLPPEVIINRSSFKGCGWLDEYSCKASRWVELGA